MGGRGVEIEKIEKSCYNFCFFKIDFQVKKRRKKKKNNEEEEEGGGWEEGKRRWKEGGIAARKNVP